MRGDKYLLPPPGKFSIFPFTNPHDSGPQFCFGWPGAPFSWNPLDLNSLQTSEIETIKNAVGSTGISPDRKLGFSLQIPYSFIDDINHLKMVFPGEKFSLILEQVGIKTQRWYLCLLMLH